MKNIYITLFASTLLFVSCSNLSNNPFIGKWRIDFKKSSLGNESNQTDNGSIFFLWLAGFDHYEFNDKGEFISVGKNNKVLGKNTYYVKDKNIFVIDEKRDTTIASFTQNSAQEIIIKVGDKETLLRKMK